MIMIVLLDVFVLTGHSYAKTAVLELMFNLLYVVLTDEGRKHQCSGATSHH